MNSCAVIYANAVAIILALFMVHGIVGQQKSQSQSNAVENVSTSSNTYHANIRTVEHRNGWKIIECFTDLPTTINFVSIFFLETKLTMQLRRMALSFKLQWSALENVIKCNFRKPIYYRSDVSPPARSQSALCTNRALLDYKNCDDFC